MKKTLALAMTIALMSSGCAGMRSANGVFSTHAESFRIIGIAIPSDDQARAKALVPAGAQITDTYSTPADWDSLWGFLGNLFWFHTTHIGGTVPTR